MLRLCHLSAMGTIGAVAARFAPLAGALALATCFAAGLAAQETSAASSEEDFRAWAGQYAGAYAVEGGRHLIIVPHTQLRLLSLFELESGMARPLEPEGSDTFLYGPNVVSLEPVEGRLAFRRGASGRIDGLRWESEGGEAVSGRRLAFRREPVRFRNGDEAGLAGWLITPPGEGPHPVAVVFQPGANDRFGLWRVAMALAVEGIGVLVYDRRNVGESTGTELPSHYWTATQVLAGDGAAAVRFARSHPRVDSTRVGVVGWSGGGWMGALVASRVPETAFYVNIAGNANPGWEQGRWNRLASLHWEGYGEEAVAEAAAFLESFYGLMHGEVTWEAYRTAVERVEGLPWFEWMEENFTLWRSVEEARRYADLERDNVPERDFAGVSAPTLGLFFQYDESSPPQTPWIFLRGRAGGPNPDVTVRVIPRTTHEAFVVDGYATAADQAGITGLAPELFGELRRWVAARVAPGDRRRDW